MYYLVHVIHYSFIPFFIKTVSNYIASSIIINFTDI